MTIKIKNLFFIITLTLIFAKCTTINENKSDSAVKYYPLHETIGTDAIAKEDVPAMVKKNINLEFSNAELIKWQSFKDYFIDFDDTVIQIYQDKEPSIYFANFIRDNHFYRVQYSTDGKLIEYEEWIDFEELPQIVKEAFNKLYKSGSIIGKVRKFTQDHIVTYRIKILINSNPFILIYDTEGKLLHKKQKLADKKLVE